MKLAGSGKRLWLTRMAPAACLMMIVAAAPTQSPAGLLNVDECVRIALENNDVVSQAATDVMSAEASFRQARSALLPSLSGSAGWTRSYPAQEVPVQVDSFFVIRSLKYGGSVGLRASQTILSLPAILSTRSDARRVRAARSDLQSTRDDVAVTVRQQFYTLLATMRSAEIETRAVTLAQEQLQRAETLFRVGSVARSDVLQAQVNLADAQQAATNAVNAVAVERGRLALDMGLDPRSELMIDSTLVLPSGPPVEALDQWVERARRSRADLRAARLRVEAAGLSVSAARAARLPEFGADWNYSRSSSSDDELLKDALYRTRWTFSLGASINLFDGFNACARTQSAKAARMRSQASYDRLEKEIILQVRESYLAVANESQNVIAAESSVRLAEENLRLQQALYESGAGTLLEWDNARLDLRRAQLTLLQAQINLVLANVRFRRSLGE